jgi:hypothetical protein
MFPKIILFCRPVNPNIMNNAANSTLKSQLHMKIKVIAVGGHGDAFGWEMSRLPHLLDNRIRDSRVKDLIFLAS